MTLYERIKWSIGRKTGKVIDFYCPKCGKFVCTTNASISAKFTCGNCGEIWFTRNEGSEK